MALIKSNRMIIRHILNDAGLQTTTIDHMINPLLYATQGVRYKPRKGTRFIKKHKILEVILTTDMDNLGKAGEVVRVAPGYFRNYLMPNFMAVPNIDKFAFLVHEQRKLFLEREKEREPRRPTEEDRMKEYTKAAHRLSKNTVSIWRYCFSDGELYKPVDAKAVVNRIAKEQCVKIDPENVHLPEPIRKMGMYMVPLLLPQSIPLPEGKSEWVLKVRIGFRVCNWVDRAKYPGQIRRIPVRDLPPDMREKYADFLKK